MRACRAVTIVALAMLVTSAVASAQAPERAIQTGVKTTDAGWATMAQVTVSLDDLPAASKIMYEAFTKLWTEALAAGLTPLGPAHVVLLSMLTAPLAGGEFSFEVQLPFIEQPTEEDLDGAGGLLIVPIEATKVAYTYHKGSTEDPQAAFTALSDSFVRLYQWLMANGHEPAGPPHIIAYGTDETGGFQAAELQVPIE